jgi:hypothetical protein
MRTPGGQLDFDEYDFDYDYDYSTPFFRTCKKLWILCLEVPIAL